MLEVSRVIPSMVENYRHYNFFGFFYCFFSVCFHSHLFLFDTLVNFLFLLFSIKKKGTPLALKLLNILNNV